ncbi:hypothetical protein KAR91_43585 [Candidatus Pacearchaeota archaeon]|nr:hypothetical protein [Candidatus Pacearchaeota archaeon]
MADFTAEEITILKKSAKLTDLYDQRSVLKQAKADAVDTINQAKNLEIDAVFQEYNPQISSLNAQIETAKIT